MEPGRDNAGAGAVYVWKYVLIIGIYMVVFVPVMRAHEGPPFPIIVDEEVGPFLVSVWTDPDIGIGTFFVIMEPLSGGNLPDITSVQIGVEPVSGRLKETVYTAEPQNVRRGARYYTEVAFDQGGMWKVRVRLEGPDWEGELYSEVEATPDGSIGPIGLIVYALPFIAVGVLWFRAIILRRRRE